MEGRRVKPIRPAAEDNVDELFDRA